MFGFLGLLGCEYELSQVRSGFLESLGASLSPFRKSLRDLLPGSLSWFSSAEEGDRMASETSKSGAW